MSVHEIRGREVQPPLAEVCGEEGEKLRDVAFVGADGVRRRVVVQREVLEKAVELLFHGVAAGTGAGTDESARAAIQPSSAARARSAYASLRSAFFFGTRASGREASAGMTRTVMLVGG